MFCERDAAYKAELIWALQTVQSSMSADSSDHIVGTFHAMFPGKISDGMYLCVKKLMYLITDALHPYCKQMLVKDIQSYLVLEYDETTNNAGMKELQIRVQYWSSYGNEIQSRLLCTSYMGHATSDDLCRKIMSAIEQNQLPLEKLIMLGSEGPNVIKRVWNNFNAKKRK